MKQIRCGVIGLGWFGEHHVDTLQQLPQADVVAVCTRREERLREIAGKYHIGKTYTDYRDLLADDDIDLVTIVTHVGDHLEPTLAAIEAGKHVFLEKPMAGTVEECDRILAALQSTDKAFMVGHVCRFDTVYALAKEEIAAGHLGTILSMHARRNLAKWITESHLQKLSALFGDGVHDLDLMLWFTGAKPKSVFAMTSNSRPQLPHDDIGWAMYRFDNDAIAVIENVWCLPENAPFAIDARMEIIGTDGAIYIDNSGSHYTLLTRKGMNFPQSTYWPKVHGLRRGFLKEEFDYFLKCIDRGEKPTVITPEESRMVVDAVLKAEQSARENRIVAF
ncbi:MAG: Gfo/Idh/MocA family oxidoreductase [Planctomycetota bacterium]|nr:Gfo/Idh/MocA family oxidoreductase [Planctomycetota bacterium]MDA1212201.1 Gfo/Idh/MocA family oxidoreductase [Planctomycetota bacterium]